MKKISRIRWLTTLMGLVVLMFTCAGCGQTAAQSNVPKPDASQSRVRIYESMVELEDDSPLIITGEISRTSVIRDIDDITDFTLLDVKVSQTLKGTVNSGSIIVRQTGSAEQGSAETLLQTGDVVTSVDGVNTTTADGLIAAIRFHAPGSTVTITYERDGQAGEVKVTLGTAG